MTSTAEADRRTVWVVDDSPLDLQRAHDALSADYEVVAFQDGVAVVERLTAGDAPDVLVIDWVMPGMTGIEVCAFVRSPSCQFRSLGIVLLTGTRSAEEVVQALSAGANDFLAKPYFAPELRARVHALMRTRRLLLQLERSEARFRTLLAKSPDPLIAVDREGIVTFANEEAAALFGAPVAQLVGRSGRELLPEFRPDAAGAAGHEGTRLLPDVRIRDRLVAPIVKWVGLGSELAATIALRDVTESRREQDRRLDFYSTVAHDLRSPLSAISLRCSLMQRGKHGLLPPAVLEDVRRIEKAVESLVALVNDFLDLARLEGAGLKLDLTPVSLVEVVSGIVEELAPLAEAGQLQLTFKPPRQPLKVVADRRRVVQVLSNLLANALKFTPPGGRVEVILAPRAGAVDVGVSDTGPGIPEEALPHIFDRFTRAENVDAKVAGSGLGLMIVRQVIEAHGGSVWVNSRLGEGSTFWFRLKNYALEVAPPAARAAGD
jgi:signal transduction histidine kinase